jgi:outer membrane protein TolC
MLEKKLIGILVFFAAISSFADMPASPVIHQPLKVGEVLDCAHRYWANRLSSGVITADLNAQVARAAWLPSLTSSASAQRELLLKPLYNQTTGNFVLSEKIFDLNRSATIDQRAAEETSAKASLEDQLLSIMQTTATAYFAASTNLAQSEIYNQRISRLNEFLDVVKELARLHVNDRTSVYNLSAELAETKGTLLQLQADLNNQLQQVVGFIGWHHADHFQLQTAYTLPPKLSVRSEAVATKLPAVQSLHAQNDAYLLNAKASLYSYLPTLSLQGTYYPSKLNYSSAAAQSPDGLSTIGGYNPSSLQLGLFLTWNIFDQGVHGLEYSHFKDQASTAQELAEARENQGKLTIESLQKQYDLSLQSISVNQEREKQASEAYQSAIALFEIGKINYLLVKDSESALFAAELELSRLQLQAAGIWYQLSIYSAYEHGKFKDLQEAGSDHCAE